MVLLRELTPLVRLLAPSLLRVIRLPSSMCTRLPSTRISSRPCTHRRDQGNATRTPAAAPPPPSRVSLTFPPATTTLPRNSLPPRSRRRWPTLLPSPPQLRRLHPHSSSSSSSLSLSSNNHNHNSCSQSSRNSRSSSRNSSSSSRNSSSSSRAPPPQPQSLPLPRLEYGTYL